VWVAGILLGFIILFLTRPQVGWVLVISQMISVTFLKGYFSRIFFLGVIFVAAFSGYFLTTPIVTESRLYFETKSVAPEKSVDLIEASKLCSYNGERVTFKNQYYDCSLLKTLQEKVRAKSPTESIVDNIEEIPYAQKVRALNADSSITQLPCIFTSTSEANKYLCIAWRVPYMSLTFLFRPFPFLDTSNFTTGLAAVENMILLCISIFIAFVIFRKPKYFSKSRMYPVYVFMVLYIVGAGSYQGNLGTAFRHKSLLLPGILVLLYMALFPQIQKLSRSKI
jgi:hypothetical protein